MRRGGHGIGCWTVGREDTANERSRCGKNRARQKTPGRCLPPRLVRSAAAGAASRNEAKDLLDAKAQAEGVIIQETQKRRNEQNAALNRDNETESPAAPAGGRITAIRYAGSRCCTQCRTGRENERHKGVVTTGEKSQRLTTTTRRATAFAVRPAAGAN